MFSVLDVIVIAVANLFKSCTRLEAENVFLGHQLNIALQRPPTRLRLTGPDRAILAWMGRLWSDLVEAVRVVKPETVLRWHRAGVRIYWRWKSRRRVGRWPKTTVGTATAYLFCSDREASVSLKEQKLKHRGG